MLKKKVLYAKGNDTSGNFDLQERMKVTGNDKLGGGK